MDKAELSKIKREVLELGEQIMTLIDEGYIATAKDKTNQLWIIEVELYKAHEVELANKLTEILNMLEDVIDKVNDLRVYKRAFAIELSTLIE